MAKPLVILSFKWIHLCNFHMILHFIEGIYNFYIMIILFTTISKNERDKKKENEMKLKGENPRDIKNLDAMVNLMLKKENVQFIDVPKSVFGETFKTFLMK